MSDLLSQLRSALAAAKPGSPEYLDIINELAYETRIEGPEEALALAQEGYELAQKLDYPRGLAFAKRNMGLVHFFQNDYEKSVSMLNEARVWFGENDEPAGLGTTYAFLGMAYWSFGDFQQGIEYMLQALSGVRGVGRPREEAWVLTGLGNFYFDIKDYEQAQKCYLEAIELFKQIDLPLGIGRVKNGLGNVELGLGNIEAACRLQHESLKVFRGLENEHAASKALNDLGNIHRETGRLGAALDFYSESLEMRRRVDYPPGQATTLLELGQLFQMQEKYDKAIRHLDEALEVSTRIFAKPKMFRAHKSLSEIYKARGDFEKALEHYEKFHELDEEVYHQDVDSRIRNMQAVYAAESTAKEAEIYRLKNVELKEKNDHLEKTLQQLNAAQAQILQTGKMAALGNLVAGLAHEMNNPVGILNSAADVTDRGVGRILELLSQNGLSVEVEENRALKKAVDIVQLNTRTVTQTAERISRIVDSLKSFSHLDQAEFQLTSINDRIDNTLTLIRHRLHSGITIIKNYGQIPQLMAYPNDLNQMFMNLLLNAAEAIEDDGTITISTRSDKSAARIEISDTGKGIPEALQKELFEPGFTEDGDRIRMRTGLYSSYNIVEKHQGQISVKSQPGKGATFTIRLPLED